MVAAAPSRGTAASVPITAPSVPSQKPSPVHVAPAQSPSGSVPAGCAVHKPSVPVNAHATQGPSHAVVQQSPSTQKPAAHWRVRSQGSPGSRAPRHLRSTQCSSVAHWSSMVHSAHVVPSRQAPVLHGMSADGLHAPVASQVGGKVSVPPLHDAAPHAAPVGAWV
jgi:hypothetical protein